MRDLKLFLDCGSKPEGILLAGFTRLAIETQSLNLFLCYMSNDKTENQNTSKLLKPGTRTEKQLIVIIAP